ncbi:hypothetical protein Tco_1086467 [Tanacetum coccineum]
MMTARKRVGPLPTHLLAVRRSVDYYSSDPFTSDDSSETSSDSSSDDLSDSSSGHSSSDHSSPALPSGTRSSHQSPTTSVPIPSPIPGALSFARADLSPPPKRIRSSDQGARGIDFRVVFEAVDREEIEMGIRGLVKVRVERVTHHMMPNDIPEPA